MLRVGLTGGIGSGKSTAARRLVERGAVLVDSDVLAREVVAAGTDGFAEVVDVFGSTVVGADGELDRPALAAVVFGDPDARARLNGIVHPRVGRRAAELVAAAPVDAIVVQDVPLLVEGGMASHFALVVVVHADVAVRVARLVGQRGMTEADARARIDAQADDGQRRAAADVWLDNGGTPADLVAAVDVLWSGRLVPFEENVRLRRVVPAGEPRLVAPDPGWPAAAARLAARVAVAAGERGRGVAHIGATAVPGLPAQDVIHLQLGVDSPAAADTVRDALSGAGFPHRPDVTADRTGDGTVRAERHHGGADPARRVHLHVREAGSPAWRSALLFRDWLRAVPEERAAYLVAERATGAAGSGGAAEAEEPWFDAAAPRAERWAVTSGWAPSLD